MPPEIPSPLIQPDHQLGRSADTELQKKSGGLGPIIGIFIILMLLALGGFYFWGAALNREPDVIPIVSGDAVL
jgi:hypothetical protein